MPAFAHANADAQEHKIAQVSANGMRHRRGSQAHEMQADEREHWEATTGNNSRTAVVRGSQSVEPVEPVQQRAVPLIIFLLFTPCVTRRGPGSRIPVRANKPFAGTSQACVSGMNLQLPPDSSCHQRPSAPKSPSARTRYCSAAHRTPRQAKLCWLLISSPAAV